MPLPPARVVPVRVRGRHPAATRATATLGDVRRLAPLLALLALAAACGGGSDEGEPERAPAPGSLRARLAEQPGPDVGLILGTSDFAVGENRISFLVVDNAGRVIEADEAAVLAAPRSLDEAPTVRAAAQLRVLDPLARDEPNAIKSAEPDTKALYVTRLSFDAPGRYWLVAEPKGRRIQAMAAIDVKAKPTAPAVGSKAPASDTPTLDDAPVAALTTANPPDRALLRHSVADSLAARAPFVVAFATPRYCSSRTCGPTLEIVDTVRRQYEQQGVRFIHVEVYEGNDPQNGVNRWMKEWKLPSEPWVFVVDREGVIRSRFEGSASVPELADAVAAVVGG